jgi:hypothetical protein
VQEEKNSKERFKIIFGTNMTSKDKIKLLKNRQNLGVLKVLKYIH